MVPIDYYAIQELLDDETADQILEDNGGLSAESLLEEQDDDRTWPNLAQWEQDRLAKMMEAWADDKGYRLERDDESCIVVSDE